MEFKINAYNEEYITIESHQIIHSLAVLQIQENTEDNELIKELRKINLSISNYEKQERKKGNIYKRVDEVTIDKNSKIGRLIINKINNPKYIYFNQITHALLKSIDSEEWDYYEEITKIIKRFKSQNCRQIDYQSFKVIVGENLTNYIISSAYLYPSKSRKSVYLYKNGKIIKTELPEKTKEPPNKAKTRTRIK